ncbi:MAG TPA: hypothetical protein VF384_06655 [Planctomycetota bacterium]
MRRAAVVAALALAGCSVSPDTEPITGPGFVLVSPFASDANELWRQLVAAEVAAVTALFGSDLPDPPVTVVLDPIDVPESATLTERLGAHAEGPVGDATADWRIRLFVARQGSGLLSVSNEARLRHELAHILLHRRCPRALLWLHEGLAHEVEDSVTTGTGLAFHPAPVRLALARALATESNVSSLWTWERSEQPDRDLESARRALASSFVRFLLEREGTGWPDALPRLAALRPQDDPTLVGAWRTWLDQLDFAALVERGTASPDAAIRRAAAGALIELAENAQIPALGASVGAATDALALGIVSDPACWTSATQYLTVFRAQALSNADVAGLCAPSAPAHVRLAGLAVAARRGAPADAAEVRALREALPAELRSRTLFLRPFLPGLE